MEGATARAHVVGLLLRPEELKQARQQLEAGALTPAAFKRIEDRAVDEAIALQEESASRSSRTASSAGSRSSGP